MTAPDLLPQATCGAPGCRRTASGGLLCADHHRKLGDTLTDLAADLTASSGVKIGGWSTGHTSGGPLKSERDPINIRLMDAQRDAPPVLEAWAVWLIAERPELVRPGGVAGDRLLLSMHLKWIVGRVEVTEFWVQMRGLWSSLRGHLPVRRCTCGGPVWAERGGAWCSWCSTHWAGADLLRLARPEAAA